MLKGSDEGVKHSELLCFWAMSFVRYYKNKEALQGMPSTGMWRRVDLVEIYFTSQKTPFFIVTAMKIPNPT
jgi:hypothetical protein